MAQHAVISGAGIAGPALAHELSARGWKTTVLERYPERRDEGQNVDIRGVGRDVLRRMGLFDAVQAANTTEVGTRFDRPDGSAAASFPVADSGEIDGPTAQLEILRGVLSGILIESCSTTDFRFGVQISDAIDHGTHVTVSLQDGSSIDADMLVIAEGLHSRSRRFVTKADVEQFGMYIAYATVPRIPEDDRWWHWQHATKTRAVHLRPDNLGTTRAMLSFFSDVKGFEDLDRDGQVAILRKTFADVGGAAPRVLAALDDGASMYFSVVGRNTSAAWSKGRIGLLGDSAFSNATFGGAGTSLALIGAHVLAGELAAGDDVAEALTRYGRVMQPYTAAAPTVRRSVVRLANPHSRFGIRVLHAATAIAAGPVGKAASAVAGRSIVDLSADELPLPDYPEYAHHTD